MCVERSIREVAATSFMNGLISTHHHGISVTLCAVVADDCVIHLQTAADGAEQFYTSATNATRLETPEQADI